MLREKKLGLYPLTNFAGIHLFPTILVFLGLLPVYEVASCNHDALINTPIIVIGVFITATAITIELIADEQMRAFKKNAKPGEFIEIGLWRFSRHPNYFGEITFWFGLWVIQMSVVPAYWWTCIGFTSILAMFLLASIPMMEEKNRKGKKGYEDYLRKVSVLMPWFPGN